MKIKAVCSDCGLSLGTRVLLGKQRDMTIEYHACQHGLTLQHRESLIAMVEWFRKMILERGQGTPELTAEYCNELIEDLKGK